MVTVRMERVDLQLCEGDNHFCASCKKTIKKNQGVRFRIGGEDCVCKRCVSIAMALLGHDPVIVREGRG